MWSLGWYPEPLLCLHKGLGSIPSPAEIGGARAVPVTIGVRRAGRQAGRGWTDYSVVMRYLLLL